MSRAVTSLRNRPQNFASNMEGERSANMTAAWKLLEEKLCFVPRWVTHPTLPRCLVQSVAHHCLCLCFVSARRWHSMQASRMQPCCYRKGTTMQITWWWCRFFPRSRLWRCDVTPFSHVNINFDNFVGLRWPLIAVAPLHQSTESLSVCIDRSCIACALSSKYRIFWIDVKFH